VRPVAGATYELVAGERRWRAAQLAGLETLPALVRPRDDADALEVALIENMAREDLNPIEEARAVAALVEELGLTREAVGRRVGRSRVAVSNLLRLLDLPDEALALVEDGTLSEGHGRALLLAPTTPTAAAWPATPRPRAGRCGSPRHGARRGRARSAARRLPRPRGGPPRQQAAWGQIGTRSEAASGRRSASAAWQRIQGRAWLRVPEALELAAASLRG
jgi:ParB family chromosome partitioning protein